MAEYTVTNPRPIRSSVASPPRPTPPSLGQMRQPHLATNRHRRARRILLPSPANTVPTASDSPRSLPGRWASPLAKRSAKSTLSLGARTWRLRPVHRLPDADIDAATAAAIFGRMQNSGQACTASKRFIVLDEVYDKFVEAFTRAVADLTVGDPSEDVAGGLPRVSQNWRIRH